MLADSYDQKKSRSKLLVNLLFAVLFIFVALREERLVRKESGFDLFLIDTLAPVQGWISRLKSVGEESYSTYINNVGAVRDLSELRQEYSLLLQSKYFSLEQDVATIRKQQKKLIERYGNKSTNPISPR